MIGRFFDWWGSELAAMVPAGIRRAVSGERSRIIMDLRGVAPALFLQRNNGMRALGRLEDATSPKSGRQQLSAALRGARRRNVLNVLVLPEERVLRKEIRLPVAALENLREVIGFELDRQTPFSAEEVFFDFRVADHDLASGRVTVETSLAPRATLDEILATVSAWGFDPEVVDVAGPELGHGLGLNLLPTDAAGAAGRGPGKLNVILAAAAVGLLVAAALLPLSQRQERLDALSQELATAKSEAQATARIRADLDRLVAESGFLSARVDATIPASTILHEITRLLADDTWVNNLQIVGKEVRITGLSASAASLIGTLQESPLFDEVRFRASVTKDLRQEMERFSLSARMVSGGGS